MKKLVALLLLGAGIASQVETSDNNYPDTPPCNLPTPSPKEQNGNSSAAPTPRASDDDKK